MIRILKIISERMGMMSMLSRLLTSFFMKRFVSKSEVDIRVTSYLIPINQLQIYVTVED